MTAVVTHQQALLALLTEFDRVCRRLDVPYVLFAGTALGAERHGGFIPWDDDGDVLMLRRDYERFLNGAGPLLGEKFHLQREFSEHWPMCYSKLRLEGTACLEEFHPNDPKTHQGIWIDLFPCDNALATGLGRRVQFAASRVVAAKCLRARGYQTDSRAKRGFMALCRLLPMGPFLRLTRAGREDSRRVHTFLAATAKYACGVLPRDAVTCRTRAPFEDRSFWISAKNGLLLTVLYGDYLTPPPPEERARKRHVFLVDTERSWEEYVHLREGMEFSGERRSIR